jgi:enoyl-[acyl-carrier protein] reductase II
MVKKNKKSCYCSRRYCKRTRNSAAMVLGADAVQVGSRFAASMESAHDNFKKTIIETKEGGTTYTLKECPVRLIKNKFFHDVQSLYEKCPTKDELVTLLGRARQNEGCLKAI